MALTVLDDRVLRKFEIAQIGPDRLRQLLAEAAESRIDGGRIYDRHIAEVARAGGATHVVTENRRHFRWLLDRGVEVVDSAGLAEELGLESPPLS